MLGWCECGDGVRTVFRDGVRTVLEWCQQCFVLHASISFSLEATGSHCSPSGGCGR